MPRLFSILQVSTLAVLLAPPSLSSQTTPRAYAAYRPFACPHIGARIERQFWREHRPDTLSPAPMGRQLSSAAVTEIRACIASMNVATTPPAQLIGLGQAALAAGDDAKAEAAFQRVLQLGASKSIDLRAWELGMIVTAYISAPIVRLDKAVEYTAMLDRLGPGAAASRLRTHNALYALASRLDSLPLMEAQVEAALRAHTDLVGDARRTWAFDSKDALLNKADLEGRRGDATAAIATLRKAAVELRTVRPSIMWGGDHEYRIMGKRAPLIQGMYVLTPGQPVSTTVPSIPARGAPSLIVFVENAADFNLSFPSYATLRRIIAKYGPRRLEVTLVGHTVGWDREQLVPDSREEVERTRDFFQNTLRIAAPLVMWKTDFNRRNDGSLHSTRLPNDSAYTARWFGAMANTAILIDRDGLVRQTISLGPASERRLENMINKML